MMSWKAVEYKMAQPVPIDKGLLNGAFAHYQANCGDIWIGRDGWASDVGLCLNCK